METAARPQEQAGSTHHLIITVHGIQTFGQWQERLGELLDREEGLKVRHLKYRYLSLVGFFFPLTRWLITRWFRSESLRARQAPRGGADRPGCP